MSTLESDIQNDYVNVEDYEEEDNDMELDKVFMNRYIIYLFIYDRIGKAQKASAMFCDILNNWLITTKLIFTTQKDHFFLFLAIGLGYLSCEVFLNRDFEIWHNQL